MCPLSPCRYLNRKMLRMQEHSFYHVLVILSILGITGGFRDVSSHQRSSSPGRIAANNLQESLVSQGKSTTWRANGQEHKHLDSMRQEMAQRQAYKANTGVVRKGSIEYAIRVGLAGGLAGAAATATLFPMDTAKTLRQSNPGVYKNVISALDGLSLRRVYRGVIPSTLGAIPSSALYFGAYESMKALLRRAMHTDQSTTRGRFLVHSAAAVSGNVLSSGVFVPKEAIKQQMQYLGDANIFQAAANLCRTRGIQGLYSGYKATLLRNIPTAALRFTIYEEFKYLWFTRSSDVGETRDASVFNWGHFCAGATAGIMASALSKKLSHNLSPRSTFLKDSSYCLLTFSDSS